MTVIDSNTVVVSNDAELYSVITETNNYNLIYFDQDITLTSGIPIPMSKSNLTIDGTYKEVRHKFTDMNSATATNTIYISGLNATIPTMKVTVQNMDIIGRNYYGVICVFDSTYAANTTTTYKNINYVGCQITYNNYGNTEYIDSTITINNTTSTRSGEIGEVHKVVIGGNTTITHTFSGFSGFHFRGGASTSSFTILPDSNVNLTLARNLFAGDNIISNMTFGANSICNITVPNGLSLNTTDRATNVLVDTGATLNVYRTSSSGSATLYVENNFIVNSGASVLFKSNVSTSEYHLYFYTTNANFIINDPASCIFYNSGYSNFYFTGTTNISFKSYQINQWNTAPAIGDIYNMPTYQWIKKNHGIIEFTGTATNTTTNISYNNLDPVEDAKLPSVTSLQLRTLRVLSLGYLPLLNVNRIVYTRPVISGKTIAGCGIKISYNSGTTYGAADSDGSFSITVSASFSVGDEVTITNSNNNFLYNVVVMIEEEPGELYLYVVPETMLFDADIPITRTPLLYGRIPEGWKIEVYDSRVYSSDWTLYATIAEDLTSDEGHSLPNSLVYVDDDSTTILSNQQTLVFTGEDNEGVEKITDVKWDENKGILLKIDTVPIYVRETYRTKITWTLME